MFDALFDALAALIFEVLTYRRVMSFPEGNALMQKISGAIHKGTNAYLRQQYSVVGVFFACLIVVLCIMAACGLLNWYMAFAFLGGGFFSGLSGFVGLRVATAANCRTRNACMEGLNRGLRVAFYAGSVMGFTVVGLVLGCWGVVGLLTGSTATGFLTAIDMANAGGAWDNAKKHIEAGNYGGKGSANHKAGAVGNPFKDTSGPAINILIKLLSIVSIVFAALVVNVHLL